MELIGVVCLEWIWLRCPAISLGFLLTRLPRSVRSEQSLARVKESSPSCVLLRLYALHWSPGARVQGVHTLVDGVEGLSSITTPAAWSIECPMPASVAVYQLRSVTIHRLLRLHTHGWGGNHLHDPTSTSP